MPFMVSGRTMAGFFIRPVAGLQGTSLSPALRGGTLKSSWSYEETLYPKINMGWSELRGVRSDHWMYIRAPKPELYDLTQDPGESSNVAANHQYEVRQFETILQRVAGGPQNAKATTKLVD